LLERRPQVAHAEVGEWIDPVLNRHAAAVRPRTVDEAAWSARRARVRAAYEAAVALARRQATWDADAAGGLAASLAHAAYHLGAMRQIAKLAQPR
jgi:hypothetical protein